MNYYTDNPVLRHYLTHPLLRRIVEMREHNFTEAEKYDYAPVDFEEAVAGYEQILTLVGELCAEVVVIRVRKLEMLRYSYVPMVL